MRDTRSPVGNPTPDDCPPHLGKDVLISIKHPRTATTGPSKVRRPRRPCGQRGCESGTETVTAITITDDPSSVLAYFQPVTQEPVDFLGLAPVPKQIKGGTQQILLGHPGHDRERVDRGVGYLLRGDLLEGAI